MYLMVITFWKWQPTVYSFYKSGWNRSLFLSIKIKDLNLLLIVYNPTSEDFLSIFSEYIILQKYFFSPRLFRDKIYTNWNMLLYRRFSFYITYSLIFSTLSLFFIFLFAPCLLFFLFNHTHWCFCSFLPPLSVFTSPPPPPLFVTPPSNYSWPFSILLHIPVVFSLYALQYSLRLFPFFSLFCLLQNLRPFHFALSPFHTSLFLVFFSFDFLFLLFLSICCIFFILFAPLSVTYQSSYWWTCFLISSLQYFYLFFSLMQDLRLNVPLIAFPTIAHLTFSCKGPVSRYFGLSGSEKDRRYPSYFSNPTFYFAL